MGHVIVLLDRAGLTHRPNLAPGFFFFKVPKARTVFTFLRDYVKYLHELLDFGLQTLKLLRSGPLRKNWSIPWSSL